MPKKTTRNAQGAGTIRQRKDGTWEARFTIGRDPGTGKQIQKSVYGKTQAEVRKKMTAAAHQLDQGIYTAPTKLTVGEWCDVWHAEYIGAVKPMTVAQYRYQIDSHIKPAIGAVKLCECTTPMIQKLYNDCKRKGLSTKSIRNMHGVLHRIMKQAVMLQYIHFNPCDACQLPRVQRKEITPITDQHVQAFLTAIKGHKYEDVFFVDMFTGMRKSEIIGLTWDCVDFKKGVITVNKQLQKERVKGGGGGYHFTTLKNDKARTITPAPAVFAVLRKVQRQQREYRLQSGGEWSNELNLVFTNEEGRHLATDTLYVNLKNVVKKIGIPETRFHDLRHTFATLSLQNGDDIKTVSENLGHATVAFTLDVYGHKLLFRGRFHLPAKKRHKPLKIKQLWLEGKPSRS